MAILLSFVVILINVYFVVSTVTDLIEEAWLMYLILVVVGTLYLLFCTYLIIHMFASIGVSSRLSNSRVSIVNIREG